MSCDRALGQAIEQFDSIDRATHESWADFLNEAGLAAYQGRAHHTLALTGRDPNAAGRAVPLLRDAVDGFDPDYARPERCACRIWPESTRSLGTPTPPLPSATKPSTRSRQCLHPGRMTGYVSWTPHWNPCHTSTGVAELRSRLAATCALPSRLA